VSFGGLLMVNLHHVQVGNAFTCLTTAEGQFIGAIVTSGDPAQPWAYVVDHKGEKVLDLRAADHEGEELGTLYTRCEHALLATRSLRSTMRLGRAA
jgi:hypothetical protein